MRVTKLPERGGWDARGGAASAIGSVRALAVDLRAGGGSTGASICGASLPGVISGSEVRTTGRSPSPIEVRISSMAPASSAFNAAKGIASKAETSRAVPARNPANPQCRVVILWIGGLCTP